MNAIARIISWLDTVLATKPSGAGNATPYQQVGTADTARFQDTASYLRALYFNNGAYRERKPEVVDLGLVGPNTKGLRSFQHAVVEFYVATIMPGGLEQLRIVFPERDVDDAGETPKALVTQQDNARQRIEQVWSWSNWASRKQRYVREMATVGESYLYVASRQDIVTRTPDRVYYTIYEPEFITDLDTDERGFLTYLRLDIPKIDREAAEPEPYVHTEIWSKATDSYRAWHTPRDEYDYARVTTRQPIPDGDKSLTQDFLIDFVPFAQAQHRDTGNLRGMAPIIPALEKFDEVNAKATEFSAQLYRHGKPDLVVEATGGTVDGMPIDPPKINTGESGTLKLPDGSRVWVSPVGWSTKWATAGVDFTSHLAGIVADMQHIRETDLPELAYYLVSNADSGMSGDALEMMLTAAVAKAREARGNAEAALIRANQMALTIGQVAKLPGFEAATIGTYEAGDFEHSIAERPILPESTDENATTLQKQAQTMLALVNAGYSRAAAAKLAGLNEEDVAAAEAMMATEFAVVER